MIINCCLRSHLIDQDWTQKSKREGTFVLESPTSPSRPNTSGNGIKESKLMSSSMNRLSTSSLKLSNPSDTDMDMMQVIRNIEDTVSPLARANSQIREGLDQLETSLMFLKSISSLETNNNSF